MNNQQIYVFGKLKPASWLNNTTARGLAAEALKRSKAAAKAKITDIIEVLNKVSLAWANPQYHLRLKAASILPKLTGFGEQTVNEGFEAISAICGKESIIKRLCGELGSLYILDGETEKTELGYSLRALPNGVLLHLTAGNVFVSAVDSLVSGIITKNANILKMSRVDSVFPVLFVESIKEFDPAGIVLSLIHI